MKYLRPYDLNALAPGADGEWLLAPGDGAGVSVRLRRGGAKATQTIFQDKERFALVLRGAARVEYGGQVTTAATDDLAFIPAGIAGAFAGEQDAVWAEIDAPLPDGIAFVGDGIPKVVRVDQSKFEGTGFAYQSMIDRKQGSRTARINVLQVQPGAGSPDWHIHAFAQLYLIQEGEMTVDIGRGRYRAGKDTLVFLPPGLAHRNFNASGRIERHVSLLVPEPKEGEVFDYAVTIHEREAELIVQLPE